jgi:putative transposase
MVVLDACTREVVGHELLRSCGAAKALSVVERAVLTRFPKTGRAPGLTLKTDGGAQFVAHRFQDGCRAIGISRMATRKRRPEDSGLMESWNGHLKQDYLWIREPTTFLETRQIVDGGVIDYNMQRPHSSLEFLMPRRYAEQKKEEQRT